jgi:hypothetical protein
MRPRPFNASSPGRSAASGQQQERTGSTVERRSRGRGDRRGAVYRRALWKLKGPYNDLDGLRRRCAQNLSANHVSESRVSVRLIGKTHED